MTTRVALALLVSALLGVASVARSADAAERRVATLVPYAGAALAAHPGQVLVVASVRSDPRAPVPDGVIDLGSPHSPNLEKLAEARPEIVVTDAQLHGNLTEALGRSWERGLPSLRVVGEARATPPAARACPRPG